MSKIISAIQEFENEMIIIEKEFDRVSISKKEKDIKRACDIVNEEFIPFSLFVAENIPRCKSLLESELKRYQKLKTELHLTKSKGDELDTPIQIITEALQRFKE